MASKKNEKRPPRRSSQCSAGGIQIAPTLNELFTKSFVCPECGERFPLESKPVIPEHAVAAETQAFRLKLERELRASSSRSETR